MDPGNDNLQRLRLANFDSDHANQNWQVVNDNVMGVQSQGGLSFDDEIMIFEGDINTNGGGFASLRLPLDAGTLTPFDSVELRARSDQRSYMVTFDDGPSSRKRQVSHRSPMRFDSPGEWQVVSVPFDDLSPAVFGRPIDNMAFRKDLANRMGLMISDGIDGPFRLEIDWIDLRVLQG